MFSVVEWTLLNSCDAYIIVGLVNAHSGHIEDSWMSRSSAEVLAIMGNTKTKFYHRTIDVVKSGDVCEHVDHDRRIKVP